MHIHGIQNNAALELNALSAEQRALAKQRAEQTRRKLSELASVLECEDDYIVTLGQQQESGAEQKGGRRRQDVNAETLAEEEPGDPLTSQWA